MPPYNGIAEGTSPGGTSGIADDFGAGDGRLGAEVGSGDAAHSPCTQMRSPLQSVSFAQPARTGGGGAASGWTMDGCDGLAEKVAPVVGAGTTCCGAGPGTTTASGAHAAAAIQTAASKDVPGR